MVKAGSSIRGEVEALARSLELLADSPARAKAMGAAGERRALTHFTAEQIVPQYEALYRRFAR